MDEKLGLPTLLDIVLTSPLPQVHDGPINGGQVGEVVVVVGIRELRMSVRERPWPASCDRRVDAGDKVDHIALPSAVVLVPSVDDVEHDGPVAEVERHILAELALGGHRHDSPQSTLLDVAVADIRALEALCRQHRIGVEPASLDDAGQVVHMRDVVDGRVLRVRQLRHRASWASRSPRGPILRPEAGIKGLALPRLRHRAIAALALV